ncbi:MAG TPA: hypothetical protein VN634_12985 [Candidatus Limnocylindrales bacterium]|nr:hypothetical protein [Candidatus Limnocylindrales bacterium]
MSEPEHPIDPAHVELSRQASVPPSGLLVTCLLVFCTVPVAFGLMLMFEMSSFDRHGSFRAPIFMLCALLSFGAQLTIVPFALWRLIRNPSSRLPGNVLALAACEAVYLFFIVNALRVSGPLVTQWLNH